MLIFVVLVVATFSMTLASAATTESTLCKNSAICCSLEKSNCKFGTFPTDRSVLVFPGGETRCIKSKSMPYAFEVTKGKKDKVLFYFQGGGCCWNQQTTRASSSFIDNTFCSTEAIPWTPKYGVFDRADPRNKFSDFTIINVLYCSGDNHVGNVVRPYLDENNGSVVQKGIANVEAVLQWTTKQQQTGYIASTLSHLVVMGCSAGAIAAQTWGVHIVERLNYPLRSSVVVDSFAGLFPGGGGDFIHDIGACTLPFLPSNLRYLVFIHAMPTDTP